MRTAVELAAVTGVTSSSWAEVKVRIRLEAHRGVDVGKG